jgi:hypothetical protein
VKEPNKQDVIQNVDHRAWVFYGSAPEDVSKIQKAIDRVLTLYSFYPEIDWGKYGCRPPEDCKVMGAWRHTDLKAFTFLLDNPSIVSIKPNIQLTFYAIGTKKEILSLKTTIETLKKDFMLEESKDKTDVLLGRKLERVHKTKPLAGLTAVLVILTGVVNVFSLYLRKLPPPLFESHKLSIAYSALVVSVHFGALCLLVSVIVICLAFLMKYGYLLLKRL